MAAINFLTLRGLIYNSAAKSVSVIMRLKEKKILKKLLTLAGFKPDIDHKTNRMLKIC